MEDECIDFSLNISRNGVGEVLKWLRSKLKFFCKYGGDYYVIEFIVFVFNWECYVCWL